MSDDPRHSDVVSVSGAGFPASVHARDAADAADGAGAGAGDLAANSDRIAAPAIQYNAQPGAMFAEPELIGRARRVTISGPRRAVTGK